MKYAVVTFGCRVNQADSLGFEDQLLADGHTPADLGAADLVIVNTCSVTASADQAARQAIRRVSRVNPGARVIVTGCYATRRPDDIRELPNVLRVVRNDDKPGLIPGALADLAGSALAPSATTRERFGIGEGPCGLRIEPGAAGRTAFTLRVQTGCDEACAYCIIPSTRGAPRSRPVADVVADVARARDAGFKEIVLTGVHLGGYGRELAPPTSLFELLQALQRGAVEDFPALRIRISSLEPKDCTTEIVDLVSRSRIFAPHFHLPLQHASNRILRAMRRPYTIELYAALVDRIRRQLPLASVGSDVIVGFPGETDRDAGELADYLEQSPLTHLHVFPYSDRPGTVAAGMEPKVPGAVIRERSAHLRRISERLGVRFKRSQRDTVHRALTIDDGTTAVTGNYLKLNIAAGWPRNCWVDVRVDDDEARYGTVIAAANL